MYFYIALAFLSQSTPESLTRKVIIFVFFIIESFLEKFIPHLQSRFNVELCLTCADSQNHRYNSKSIPQFETTNYLAKKKRRF